MNIAVIALAIQNAATTGKITAVKPVWFGDFPLKTGVERVLLNRIVIRVSDGAKLGCLGTARLTKTPSSSNRNDPHQDLSCGGSFEKLRARSPGLGLPVTSFCSSHDMPALCPSDAADESVSRALG